MTELNRNRFKAALAAGKQQIGLWAVLANASTTEIAAGAGFDWLLLDAEHAPNDVTTLLAQLQASSAYPVTPIVRPAWNDPVLIKRYLDIGAQSLLIPYVQTRVEAEQAVASTRYPPAGIRGVGGSSVRASHYGRIDRYIARAADELCVLVQIETRLGLDNLEEIANVAGVDGVFIGPADLAASLGHPGNPGHPDVRAAIDDAVRRIIACGNAPGLLMVDEVTARRYLDMGVRFMAVGIDATMLARATEQLAARYGVGPETMPAAPGVGTSY
jgi:4-hydroxy-2-oxoheptanedioate aldolase